MYIELITQPPLLIGKKKNSLLSDSSLRLIAVKFFLENYTKTVHSQ